MGGSDFEGSPFTEAEEWQRLRRIMHEHDETRHVVKAITTVISAAQIIKAVAPWAIFAATILILWLNRGALPGVGGG